jgi:hypothetical protein
MVIVSTNFHYSGRNWEWEREKYPSAIKKIAIFLCVSMIFFDYFLMMKSGQIMVICLIADSNCALKIIKIKFPRINMRKLWMCVFVLNRLSNGLN